MYTKDLFYISSRRRHTRLQGDWSSDVCSSDLKHGLRNAGRAPGIKRGSPAPRSTSDSRTRPARRPEGEGVLRLRSEERRVGKEGRSWMATENENQRTDQMRDQNMDAENQRRR